MSGLSWFEAKYGDPTAAFDHVTVAIRNCHASGNTAVIHGAVAVVATIFDRLGHHEPAATIAMTTAAMAAYTYDQIDQARSELNAVSK